ncbi:MAG: glycosyltransferase family 39 protein, partial [Anaerolineae bacterium]|nr:glycosyltransferase family 39 protein [Anaerolineae bacterium]
MRLYRPLTAPPRAPSMALACLLAALIMLAAVSVQTMRFADRNYREDEVNMTHAARTKTIPEIVYWTVESGIHPAAWSLLAPAWVQEFGQHEPVTRYLATLMTLLALALVYRLGADLFDRQVGLIALLLLAAIPFFQFHAHEFRPYSMLTALVAGATFVFIRWLRQPGFRYALLYVICGVLAVQTHYYAVYVILAHAIMLLIVVRWERGLYLRAFGLFAAIGISFLPWVLAILQTALLRPDRGIVTKGGLSYALPSNFEGLFILNQNLQGLPLLTLTALIIPVGAIYPYLKYDHPARDAVFRFGQEWRRWALIVLSLSVIALAFIANTQIRNLTPRNMIVLLPSLAVLAAFQIRAMGPGVRRWLIVLLVLIGVFVFH